MHDHPSPGGHPAEDPFERAQQLLLLELVVDPPAAGDRIFDLASRLGLSAELASSAVAELVTAGLAQIDGDVVRASAAASRFEALWPIAP